MELEKNKFIKNYKHKPKDFQLKKSSEISNESKKIKIKYYNRNNQISVRRLFNELQKLQKEGFTHIVNISSKLEDIIKYQHYFPGLQFTDNRIFKHIAQTSSSKYN